MRAGDIVRVRDWPGTAGKRYKVVEVRQRRGVAWCLEDGEVSGWRALPLDRLTVDRGKTKRARARRKEGK